MNDIIEFLRNRRVYRVKDSEIVEVPLEYALEHIDKETIAGSLEWVDGSRATPTIRIVFTPDKEHLALDSLAIFRSLLDAYGASDSCYVVRTPRFYELRLNERSFSESLSHAQGIELAKTVVSYVLSKLESRLRRIALLSEGKIRFLNVAAIESRPTLVAPLTRFDGGRAEYMHLKELDSVLSPSDFHHSSRWSEYREGALDKLATEALNRCRGVVKLIEATATARSLPRVVGRFEVMALLQAARYYVLTGDLDKAKSFGLNRAIFYAWAKYYGPRGRAWVSMHASARKGAGIKKEEPLLDEVPRSARGYFVMDGKEQLPEDFDRQIRTKFEALIPWEVVWRRALAYVKMFPSEVLRDPNKFFKYVYEPIRDVFIERIVLSPPQALSPAVEKEVRKEVSKAGERIKTPVRRLTDFIDKGQQ